MIIAPRGALYLNRVFKILPRDQVVKAVYSSMNVLTFLLVLPLAGQPSTIQQTTLAQSNNPQPAQDAQALAILNQSIAAAGSAATLSAIQDFSASGTITYYWDPAINGSATVQGRGPGQFRIDATLPDGLRTVIVSNGTGSITETNGSVRSLTYQVAINLGSMTFPYTTLIAALQDTSVKITYLGLVDHAGSQFHDIKVQKIYPSNVDPNGSQSTLSARDFFVDPNTLLVASVMNIAGQDADGNNISREVLFANYQTVGGVAVPFQITERIHDQSMVTLQLTQIGFNAGLSDSTFTN
jgi:outer membrane lipoprotein-sorting protein